MHLSTLPPTSNSFSTRQKLGAHTLSRFAVKANPQTTKKFRSIVRTIVNESSPGSRDDDSLKLSQESQTSRRDTPDLNKKIADDTLLPPSMREPGAKKSGTANDSNTTFTDNNIGKSSARNASVKKHSDSEELETKVFTQKIFKTD